MRLTLLMLLKPRGSKSAVVVDANAATRSKSGAGFPRDTIELRAPAGLFAVVVMVQPLLLLALSCQRLLPVDSADDVRRGLIHIMSPSPRNSMFSSRDRARCTHMPEKRTRTEKVRVVFDEARARIFGSVDSSTRAAGAVTVRYRLPKGTTAFMCYST